MPRIEDASHMAWALLQTPGMALSAPRSSTGNARVRFKREGQMNRGLKARVLQTAAVIVTLGVLFVLVPGTGAQVSPALSPTPAITSEPKKPKLEISWEDKLLTLDVAETEIQDVIKAISSRAGVQIDIYAGVQGKVTLREEKAPLEKVVDDLLAAIGQRNYLMVFDGGGLTRMSIVPKGTGGAGLSEAAKRVKVKEKLHNGKEIEYFPGEIIVGVNARLRSKQPDDYTYNLVRKLEQGYGLSLVKQTRVAGLNALKFRILGRQSALDVMYKVLSDPSIAGDFAYVTPNGLGPESTEMPEEDFQNYEWTEDDARAARAAGMTDVAYRMAKHPFLKMAPLGRSSGERSVPRAYVDKQAAINLSGADAQLVTYDDVLSAVGELGGMVVDHASGTLSELYYVLFPNVIGDTQYSEKIVALRGLIMPVVKDRYSVVGPVPWVNPNGMPNDTEYLSGNQWNLGKIRAEHAWTHTAGVQRDNRRGG
jgi:hypothetical protein